MPYTLAHNLKEVAKKSVAIADLGRERSKYLQSRQWLTQLLANSRFLHEVFALA